MPTTEPQAQQNTRPLPECLYCPNCGKTLLEGFRASVSISGTRWDICEISTDRYQQIESNHQDEETEEQETNHYICNECENHIETSLWNDLKWLNKLATWGGQEENRLPAPPNSFQQYRLPQTFEEIQTTYGPQYKFHKEVFNQIKKMLDDGDCPQFNINHEVYQDIQEPEEPAEPEQPDEEPNPEDQRAVIGGNHQRWGRGIYYPKTTECPKCKKDIIVEDSNPQCPDCLEIISTAQF